MWHHQEKDGWSPEIIEEAVAKKIHQRAFPAVMPSFNSG
jgi:hypothetical protein